MNKKEIFSVIVLIFAIGFSFYRYQNKSYKFFSNKMLMDTVVTLSFEMKNPHVNEVADSVFQLMEDYENKLSAYREKSYIYIINHAETDSFASDKDVCKILTKAKKLYEMTEKRYDVTVGELTDIWDFEKENVPTEEEIKTALKTVGFDKLIFNENFLKKPAGTKINLGSAAKGFILDRVADYLGKRKVLSGYVNAGGDIRFFGNNQEQTIGIRHPRKSDEIIATVTVKSGATVTSGDYERFFIKDGKRYHHIIDPLTGYPSENSVSVTVLADTAEKADIFSTALFLLKPQEAIDLAEKSGNIEAVVYYETNNKITALKTSGMKLFPEKEN
ncbi:MAG: hypothetical protein CSB55_06495 [Candidatus Cloacimonadota bacterium]|nr:MAG: hypothetical protein CSB55_06495 [Candidatus Cloacimonadota bacterium]